MSIYKYVKSGKKSLVIRRYKVRKEIWSVNGSTVEQNLVFLPVRACFGVSHLREKKSHLEDIFCSSFFKFVSSFEQNRYTRSKLTPRLKLETICLI